MSSTCLFCFLAILIDAQCSLVNRELPKYDIANDDMIQAQNDSEIAPDKYIAGGQPAGVGQFPWVVRLSITVGDSGFLCGGSLISQRHVLTAAHCLNHDIKYYSDIKIYLGEYDTRSFPNDCAKGKCTKNELVYPDKIIRHGGYDAKTVANDIALLRLQKQVRFSATIQPIPLPPFDVDNPINNGAPVEVMGWGRTEKDQVSSILLTTEVSLISKRNCLNLDPKVPAGHLCAGDPRGKDTCPGDSGGPLIMKYKNKYYVSGVVSYGPGKKCGTAKAGYYTNVYKYKKWIKRNMKA